jgi:hypothetical protein
MKQIILLCGLMLGSITASAQNSYIVKTRGAKQVVTVVNPDGTTSQQEQSEEEKPDFVSKYFKHYTLCDWQEGMKFMVLPTQYDLIVNTFCDAQTGKEVGSGSLRYKLMVYKRHENTAEGNGRVYFDCPDNNKEYYFETPNGTFEEYCENKLGVPTLAYIGDVDIARTKLLGATLYTKLKTYYVDSHEDANGVEEVTVPLNQAVKVVAIGAGTRAYPVKIIVEDNKGKQFFQNVALSKTNCGMRDDEFIMDNAAHLFNNAFQYDDETVATSGKYAQYVGKYYYTRRATKMDGPNGEVRIARMSEFIVKSVQAQSETNYVKMTLKSTNDGKLYTKQVTFVNDNVAGDIDGYHEDYFPELFLPGHVKGKYKNITKAQWTAISKGRAIVGMTKQAVKLAKGDPNSSYEGKGGRVDWIYEDKTVVKFKNGRVIKVELHD